MKANMTIEKVAALAWRFIGLFIVLAAIPGMLSVGRLILRAEGIGHGGVLVTAFVVGINLILGVLIIRFSEKLGRIIADGL